MSIETEFNKRILDLPDIAEEKSGERFPKFRKMLNDHGGIGTAKRLLQIRKSDSGYGNSKSGFNRLYVKGLKSLTVEALVVEFKDSELFSPNEIEIAEYRLRTGDY